MNSFFRKWIKRRISSDSNSGGTVNCMEGSIETYFKFGLAVLLTLVVYRLLVKPVTPASVQGWIGL